jgi:hypothetical protein
MRPLRCILNARIATQISGASFRSALDLLDLDTSSKSGA